MWTCTCKTQNRVSTHFCTNCKSTMPLSERRRIYKLQLEKARKELGIDYKGSFEKTVQEVLGDKSITVDKMSDWFFRILQVIVVWFVRYRKRIIISLIIITFFSSVTSLFSPESKYIREETRIRNKINRSSITSVIVPKIKSLPDRFGYYFDNPANKINEENRQRFKERFSKINAFIDDTKQNIEEKLKEYIEKIKEMEKWYLNPFFYLPIWF